MPEYIFPYKYIGIFKAINLLNNGAIIVCFYPSTIYTGGLYKVEAPMTAINCISKNQTCTYNFVCSDSWKTESISLTNSVMLENHKCTWTYFYLLSITQIFTNENICYQRKKKDKKSILILNANWKPASQLNTSGISLCVTVILKKLLIVQD